MDAILDAFWGMTPLEAFGWMLAENFSLFALAVAAGEGLIRLFPDRPVGPPPPPVEGGEVALALGCVFMNAVVTMAGWCLWRAGILTIRRGFGWRSVVDAAVLLVLMDLAMYASHRLAHWRWVYRFIHATHHRYDHPRPLDLFVLNPVEVLGFGALWLGVLWLYPASWAGILIYLTLNLAFGMIGHLGVEPFPKSWGASRILRHVGTSTFHAGHHHDRSGNYGFYTLAWDRIFRTLHPGYDDRFRRNSEAG